MGNWWRFKQSDFISSITDTIQLKVVSEQTIANGKQFNCEIIKNSSIVDSSTYILTSNSIEYIGKSSHSIFGNFIFKFPFENNTNWIGQNTQDTVLVNGKLDSYNVLGNKYSPVYTIKRNYYLIGGYSWNQDIILVPKIGIVNQSYREFNSGIIIQKDFNLIDYNIQ